jgi:hypothetical protein
MGLQECQILLTLSLLVVGAFKLPELAQGLADAVPELTRADAVLAFLLALTAVATLGLDLDAVGRDLERSLSVLTGSWR